jgi:secernin
MEEYGQGGNSAEHFAMSYHNSFLLADETGAWVLETAGRYWVAEKITHGTRSISNCLSIHGKGDLRHPELERIVELDFAQQFSEGGSGTISPLSREGRVRQLCQLNEGKFTVEIAKSILRDHTGDICMHGEFETRGSQVSALGSGGHSHWFIKAPFPCQQKYRLKLL